MINGTSPHSLSWSLGGFEPAEAPPPPRRPTARESESREVVFINIHIDLDCSEIHANSASTDNMVINNRILEEAGLEHTGLEEDGKLGGGHNK